MQFQLRGLKVKLGRLQMVVTTGILCAIVAGTIIASTALTHASNGWTSFTDPLYGFSLQYPSNWTLIREGNGSNITLYDPVTTATISPIVTTQNATPATILQQPLPATAKKQTIQSVAGHQAIDYILPYSIPKLASARSTYGTQSRVVIVPVANIANSSNTSIYTFLLTQWTNGTGGINTSGQADLTTFASIVQTFSLPTQPLRSNSTLVNSTTNCGLARICWADNNWSFTNYTDTAANAYSIYCDDNGYNVAYSTNPQCINGGNTRQAAVPTSNAYFQPNFECAEFLSRALAQNGFLPGLNSGGVGGTSPASASSTYGNYKGYDLINVGTSSVKGLSQYLLNNNIAINVGTNKAQAQAGDIIFFRDSTGNYYHAGIITAVANGIILFDAHNIAQYHGELFNTSGFDIYHFTTEHSGPAVASNTDGRLEVLAHGSDGNVWHTAETAANGPWNGWSPLQATITTQDTPSIIASADGHLVAFARGSDSNIWYGTQDTSTDTWTWNPLQSGYSFQSDPAVAKNQDGRLEIVAVGISGNIWYNVQQTPNGAWAGWQPIQNGFVFQNNPTIAANADGRLEVFAHGSDGNIWHAYETAPNGSWSNWLRLSVGYVFAGGPAVGKNADGRLEVIVRGSDNRMWHAYQGQPNASFGGWSRLPGTLNGYQSDPIVGKNADGRLEIFALANDGDIWHSYQYSPNSSFGGWSILQSGYVFRDVPSIGYDKNGCMELFAVNSNGNIWHNVQHAPSSSWLGWNPLQNGYTFE